MLVGGRYTGGLGIGLLMVSGCVRFNPAFEQTASASGAQSGTSAAESSGLTTSGSATTEAKTGTTDEGTTDEGATSTSSSSQTSSSGISDDESSTAPPLFDLGDEDLPTVVFYASTPILGDFAALAGRVASAGSQACVDSADQAELDLACNEVFPILGWPERPLGSLERTYPALGLAPLVNVTGEEIAPSFDALLDGTVDAEFAELVGATGDGRFWWGYSGAGDLHCGSWSELDLQGTTRLFAGGVDTNAARPCADDYRLLCACIESPG